MPQRKIIESSSGELRFEFVWPQSSTAERKLGPTFGELTISLGDSIIWGQVDSCSGKQEGITDLWIELLEHLGTYWLQLMLEQGYPFGVWPVVPSRLNLEIEKRWENSPVSESDEDRAYSFAVCHNLAASSGGTVRPDLWVIRNGGVFVIEGGSAPDSIVKSISGGDVCRVFTEVGDTIAERLANATDSRSDFARQVWMTRESASAEKLARIATGLQDDYVRDACAGLLPDNFFRDPDSLWVGDNACFELAYQCKGVLQPKVFHRLLEKVRLNQGRISPILSSISQDANEFLQAEELPRRKPYQQGHVLAIWLRQQLGNPSGRIDPNQCLSNWNVEIDELDLESPKLDAVAYWAHERQPRVILNLSDKHRENEGARRATLAHEMCHLLIDRPVSLPLAAVVGGAIERKLEQRANAFSAELLCPRQECSREYQTRTDVDATVRFLTNRFGVSNELAALQLAQSGLGFNPRERRAIERLGPPNAWYPWT